MLFCETIEISYDELKNFKMKEKSHKPFILCINKENIKFEFLIKINNSDKALFLGSGAYNPEKIQLPIFQRKNWIDDFDYNMIYYNDPTLYMGDITLGWGYGTKDRYFLEEMNEIIVDILGMLNIKKENSYFYGSSGGGFMSIMLATMCKGSTAIVNNPQTSIIRYFPKSVKKLFEAIYGQYDENNMENNKYVLENMWRISVTELMKKLNNTPNLYYLQNLSWISDVKNQLIVFLDEEKHIEYKGNLQLFLYHNKAQGHDPISKEGTIQFINSIMNNEQIKIIQ